MSWITSGQALTLTGRGLSDVDSDRFDAILSAAVAQVEAIRTDLFNDDRTVFTPTNDVLLGTAMLAGRWYDRGVAPLGVAEYGDMGGAQLRFDPDIQKLIGIGWGGRFVFGASS